jgi:hypothetical protein
LLIARVTQQRASGSVCAWAEGPWKKHRVVTVLEAVELRGASGAAALARDLGQEVGGHHAGAQRALVDRATEHDFVDALQVDQRDLQ